MILITGGTGSVGIELTRLLSDRGIRARAMVRSSLAGEKLAALPGIELVSGDFNDPGSLDKALAGIERAFLLTNSSEHAQAQQLAFVAAARRNGVRHIVKQSQLKADAGSPVRFLRYHAVVEQAIKDAGIGFTFLRANLFMQALLAFRNTIVEDGKFFAPVGDAGVSVVDTRDLAAAAAAALTQSGHEGHTYDLTGPQALSHAQIARRMAQILDRPVQFIDIPPDAMRQAVLGMGFPAWQAEGLIEDYAHYARGEAAEVSTGVEDATGRKPRDFDSFMGDHAKVF